MDENTAFNEYLRNRAAAALVFLIAGVALVVTALATSNTAYGQDSDQFELNRLVGYSVGEAISLDEEALSCGNDSSQSYTKTLDKAGTVCGKSIIWALTGMAEDMGTTPRELVIYQRNQAVKERKDQGGCESEKYRFYIKTMKIDFANNLANIKHMCQ